MKKLQHLLLGMILLVSFTGCATPIKHATTATFKVAGNCEMCKEHIEKAANRKGVARATWDVDSKLLELTYDIQKTTSDEVLKRIAYAGYDNEKFLAPDEAYKKLSPCCQYDRMKKEAIPVQETTADTHPQEPVVQEQQPQTMKAVYAQYFTLKDALVKDDGTTAATSAAALSKAIAKVDMTQLSAEQHTVWMQEMKHLQENADRIAATKDVAKQRGYFSTLSTHLYPVMKVYKAGEPVYYQHCPMYNDGAGADWLSKENTVRNPYYGNAMLTCGKTTETIK